MDVLARARERGWYHTLELPGVTTSGLFDMRRIATELLDSKVERVVCSDLRRHAGGARHFRPRLLRLGAAAPARPASGARADREPRQAGGMFVSAEEYEPVTDLVPFPLARFRGNRNAAARKA